MSIVLRLEIPEHPPHPPRVHVHRERDGLDYGWIRLDELPHLITAMTSPDEADEGTGQP